MASLDLGLVVGPQGPQGEAGPQGPQGIQGVQGIQGPPGEGAIVDETPTEGSGNAVSSGGVFDALVTKQGTITGGATTITNTNLTANRALVSDASGKVAVSAVTSTELGYLDGVTAALQTQINNRLNMMASQTANRVLAAPNGSAGAPTFRALVANDLPTATVAKGGTGKSSWTANRLIYPSAATTLAQLAFPTVAGSVLTQNTSGAPFWQTPANLLTAMSTMKIVVGDNSIICDFSPQVAISFYRGGNSSYSLIGFSMAYFTLLNSSPGQMQIYSYGAEIMRQGSSEETYNIQYSFNSTTKQHTLSGNGRIIVFGV